MTLRRPMTFLLFFKTAKVRMRQKTFLFCCLVPLAALAPENCFGKIESDVILMFGFGFLYCSQKGTDHKCAKVFYVQYIKPISLDPLDCMIASYCMNAH